VQRCCCQSVQLLQGLVVGFGAFRHQAVGHCFQPGLIRSVPLQVMAKPLPRRALFACLCFCCAVRVVRFRFWLVCFCVFALWSSGVLFGTVLSGADTVSARTDNTHDAITVTFARHFRFCLGH